MANRLFALLVGIDRYANPHQAPSLRGCVADVLGSYALLAGRFGVPGDQICLLTARLDQSESPAQAATRANIIAGWRQHLAQAGSDDVVFFHYSGHGSQTRSLNPGETTGYEPSLVPHDSRTPGVYDLTAQELALLVHEVEQRGAQVILLLDCCHAVNRLRQVSGQIGVRCCAADERLRPAQGTLSAVHPSTPRPRATPSGWLPAGSHLLLAACRKRELSYELCLPGVEASPGGAQWQGAVSHFFHQAAAAAGPQTSWAQLHDAVLAQVHAVYPYQSPQLEGPAHLALWGRARLSIRPDLPVMAVEGNEYIQVGGGAALGLTPGTRLALDASTDISTDISADISGDISGDISAGTAGEPLAYGLVEEVQIDHAWAKLDRLVDVPETARARILALGWAAQPYLLQTSILAVRQALVAGDHSPFLLLADESSPPPCLPDFVVDEEDGLYLLRDANGESLVEVQPQATPEGALQAVAMLEHLAVYRNIQRLVNPWGGALAEGLVYEAVSYSQVGRAGRPLDAVSLHDSGHTATIDDGHKLQVTLYNQGDAPLYLAVLSLDSDYGITRIYPARSSYQLVQPQGSAVLEPIEPRITGLERTQSRTLLKVMATRVPTSFDVLQLAKLMQGDGRAGPRAAEGTTLGRLLNGVRWQGVHDLALAHGEGMASWAALHLELTVLGRPASQPLIAGATQVEAADGWLIEKPADFEGEWLVSHLDLATRGLDDPGGLRLAPGLDTPEAADYFRAVTCGEATRSTSRAPVLVGLAAAADHLASIHPARPLRVEMAVDDETGLAGIVPIAYDGRFFYLAGLPAPGAESAALPGRRRLACELLFLPPPVEAGDDPVGRDLKRTVRLLFYKLFDNTLPGHDGLRQVDLADGRAVYRMVSGEEVRRARRVALLIPGYPADTRRLAEPLWPLLQTEGGYDLCLVYECDTLGTGIRRNAQQLANALQQAGIGPDDAIALDLFSHSIGSQVARALVELLGGDAYVDRLFMAGPPNAGLAPARGRGLLPWLGNLRLNLADSVPPALLAHWLLQRFAATAQGLSDLEPESAFYQELNAPWRVPAAVPYFVQIGDGGRAFPQGRELARRLMQGMDPGLDALFSQANDLVVGDESARALEGRRPHLTVAEVPAHHFGYYQSEESLRILAGWLRRAPRS